MCRMLAVMSLKPVSQRYLQDFRRLAEEGRVSVGARTRGHRDGWGVVHVDEAPVCLGRRALEEDGEAEANAATSKEFERVCAEAGKGVRGVLLAHLRKASSGRRVRENTAPFVGGDWAFTHNGTIVGLGSDEVSDSRVFFKMFLEAMGETGDAVEAVRRVVGKIRRGYKYSSLTFLLSSRRSVYAFREFTRDKDYYTLKYAAPDDSTLIFTQEDLWSLKLFNIPNRNLVIAERNLKIEGPLRI